jgi:hypothetical protein
MPSGPENMKAFRALLNVGFAKALVQRNSKCTESDDDSSDNDKIC